MTESVLEAITRAETMADEHIRHMQENADRLTRENQRQIARMQLEVEIGLDMLRMQMARDADDSLDQIMQERKGDGHAQRMQFVRWAEEHEEDALKAILKALEV